MTRLPAVVLTLALLSGCPACFERKLNNEGRPYPCDPSLGEDPADGGRRPDGGERQCSAGWRCGLEGICHERGDAGAFACIDDSWCEASWECGPDERCGPFIDDGLKPGDLDAGTVVWVSPITPLMQLGALGLDRMPDVVAAAPEEPVGPGFLAGGMLYVVDGGLVLLGRARVGPPQDATGVIGTYLPFIFTATLPTSDVRGVAVSATATPSPLVLSDQGVGYVYTDFDGGGLGLHVTEYVQPQGWDLARGEELRLVAGPFPYAFVFGDAGLFGLEYPQEFPAPDGGRPSGFSAPAWSTAPPVTLSDAGIDWRPSTRGVVDVTSPLGEEPFELLVANIDDELVVAERKLKVLDGGTSPRQPVWQGYEGIGDGFFKHIDSPDGGPVWSPAIMFPVEGVFQPLPHLPSGYQYLDAGVFRPGRLRSYRKRIAIEVFFNGSTEPQLLLGQVGSAPVGPRGEHFPFMLLALPPCSVCPAGSALQDFRPEGDQEPLLEARCTGASGERTALLRQAVGDFRCASFDGVGGPGLLGDRILPARGLVGHGGWAGAHGQLWNGANFAAARSLFLDRPPQVLVNGLGEVAALDDRVFYFLLPDRGFFASSGLPETDDGVPIASVIGRDEWVVTRAVNIGRRSGPGLSAEVANRGASVDLQLVGEPYHAAVAHAGDGGVVVIVTSKDGVFSGDVTNIFNQASAQPGVMEFRIVPSIRVPIRSLAAVDAVAGPGGEVPYAHAWVLARSELFEVTGQTPEVWRSLRRDIPEGAAVKVLGQGSWGRLGYADGRVFSLPQLKALAPPFDGGFEDYYQYRGQTWALSAAGLFRLDAPTDGGVTGQWVSGPLVPDRGQPFDYMGARYYEAAGALYVINRFGWAFRLR